jgi:uncharacterized protein YcbK (DUF882 family)
MIWVTEHFRLDEFRCNDGAPVPARYLENITRLCENLEDIRRYWGRPVTILSGYRSPKYNKAIGGAKNSFHMKGMAADIVIAKTSASDVYTALEQMTRGLIHNGGLGKYKNFTHYDIGPARRWQG